MRHYTKPPINWPGEELLETRSIRIGSLGVAVIDQWRNRHAMVV